MELLEAEADWSDLVMQCADVKTWFVNVAQDPALDIAKIAVCREAYPWIEIEGLPDAGRLLIFQHYESLVPRFAQAAKRVQRSVSVSAKRANERS